MGRSAFGEAKAAAVALSLLVISAPRGAAETIAVPGDFSAIQDALDAAADGDTVLIAPGEYVISVPLRPSRAGEPRKDIVLRGGGAPEETVIRMAVPAGAWDTSSVLVLENGETRATRIENLTLTAGSSRLGGGVFLDGASPTLAACRIVENDASFGGGLAAAGGGTPLLVDSVLQGNRASEGGGVAVFTRGPLEVQSSVIERNYGFSGGAVYAPPASGARFESSTIAANAAFEGGGFYLWGDRTVVTDCVIADNWAQEGGGGAWVVDGSEALFDGVTFIGNQALYFGGGLGFTGDVSAIVRSSVIAGNSLGVYSEDGASPSIINSTVARNFGAPLFCVGGASPRLLNTIVWGNYHGDVACGEFVASPVGEDPRFVRPGEFYLFGHVRIEVGGELREMPDMILDPGDYRLEADSPAIDAGRAEGAPPTDRDGHGRPCGAGVDLGAYERGGCPAPAGPRFQRGDGNADGTLDLSDSVFVLDFLFLGVERLRCLSAADTNDSGGVDISDPVHLLNHLFLGAERPGAPYRECGLDPTLDALACETQAACATGS
jgi:hypothetical protein